MALLLLTGCGPARPETAPLAGTVTLDGQPLSGAALVFTPVEGGRPAQAVSDAEGRFEAWTFEPGDGALLGEHRVAVSLVSLSGVQATADGLEGAASGPIRKKSVLPARYGNAQTSGLSVQVDSGGTSEVDLALTRP